MLQRRVERIFGHRPALPGPPSANGRENAKKQAIGRPNRPCNRHRSTHHTTHHTRHTNNKLTKIKVKHTPRDTHTKALMAEGAVAGSEFGDSRALSVHLQKLSEGCLWLSGFHRLLIWLVSSVSVRGYHLSAPARVVPAVGAARETSNAEQSDIMIAQTQHD